jgi:hypothetical protein
MITTDMIKSIEIIEKLKLTKKSEVPRSKNQEKLKKGPRTAPQARLRTFTMKKDDIYKLILGFQCFQVGRMRSIAL